MAASTRIDTANRVAKIVGGMGLRNAAWTRIPCTSMTSFTAWTKSATVGVGAAAAASRVMPHSATWSSSERSIASARVRDAARSSRAWVYARSTWRACAAWGSGRRSARSHAVPMAFASSTTSVFLQSKRWPAIPKVKASRSASNPSRLPSVAPRSGGAVSPVRSRARTPMT